MSATPADTAPVFKSLKKLTLPTFKFEKDKTLYLLLLDVMHVGKKRGKPRLRPDGTEEDPPTLCHVINMSTGEHGQIMCAAIINTELSESYPKYGYVGHAFGITKQARKEGKRYDPYSIEEVEVLKSLQDEATAAAKEAAKRWADENPTDAPKSDAPKSEEAPAANAPRGKRP